MDALFIGNLFVTGLELYSLVNPKQTSDIVYTVLDVVTPFTRGQSDETLAPIMPLFERMIKLVV